MHLQGDLLHSANWTKTAMRLSCRILALFDFIALSIDMQSALMTAEEIAPAVNYWDHMYSMRCDVRGPIS